MIGFLILCGILLTTEGLFRIFFSRTYHPFGHPIYTKLYSKNSIRELFFLIKDRKKKDRIRILVTGGSTAHGIGATSIEAAFPAQLQKILTDKFPQQKFEVLNAGVGSFTSVQELDLYLILLRKLNPDLVIMFSGFNDLRHSIMKQFSPEPYREFQKLDQIQFVGPLQSRALLRSLLFSILLNMNRVLLKISRIYQVGHNFFTHLDTKALKSHISFDREVAAEELEMFLNVIVAFQAILERQKSKFLFIMQPIINCGQKESPHLSLSWIDARLKELYLSVLKPKLNILGSTKIKYMLNLNGAVVDQLLDRKGFVDSCHLNDTGYRYIAEKISQTLVKKNILDLP